MAAENVRNVALYHVSVDDSHARLLFHLSEKLKCGYYPPILNANIYAVLLCHACAMRLDLPDVIE